MPVEVECGDDVSPRIAPRRSARIAAVYQALGINSQPTYVVNLGRFTSIMSRDVEKAKGGIEFMYVHQKGDSSHYFVIAKTPREHHWIF